MPTPNFTLLVVEDDDHKLTSIFGLIHDIFPDANIVAARSVTSAVRACEKGNIDFAIVDMSLPTFDFSVDKAGGGKPQSLGGTEVLRFMEAIECTVPAVVLTQHGEFPNNRGSKVTFQTLAEDLAQEFGDWMLGAIYYSGQAGAWRRELTDLIKRYIDEK
ncbi:hypothetical protein [Burkholderia catarinensis]|uniref:hypothetical protein n=1 Tax=Burkholderia catarinensis TaxID=1108140 RepID=UPI001008353F|nr:hypothetical protein [Burkholderia catarinensis]